jgi:hypothetical protein
MFQLSEIAVVKNVKMMSEIGIGSQALGPCLTKEQYK